MSVLSYPHDLVSPYYRAHQRDNRSREDDSFKPQAATPAKNSVQSEYQRDGEAKLNTTTAAIEMNDARSCICIGNLVPCRRGNGGRWPGRCRSPPLPASIRPAIYLSEQDLNLAQQACDSRRSSIAAGAICPGG